MAVVVAQRARHLDALADRDVIELVRVIGVLVTLLGAEAVQARQRGRLDDGRQHADVGHVAGHEQHRVALVLERAQAPLQLAVDFQVAAQQARLAVADAVAVQALLGRRHQARVVGQRQVVIGAERDYRFALGHEGRVGQGAVYRSVVINGVVLEPVGDVA